MKNFTGLFEKIKKIAPTGRGLRFERLFYEIFESHGILLERSYKNEDGSQQIDGAIEIYNRIFLIEIKWEKSETLSASKLYSFLGKINSKIEGTLGIFISYNELSENFLVSTRAGLKQNCIVIHGEDNVLPIISGEISLSEYIWYVYQQASTKNRSSVPVSEFKSLPQKRSSSTANDKWKELYDALISEEIDGNFELKLEENYSQIDGLPEKIIILFPILRQNSLIKGKLDSILNKAIDNNKFELFNSLIIKLSKSDWLKYADEYILEKMKNLDTIKSEQADEIANNILPYLREHENQWEEENKASLVLDFIYDYLEAQAKKKLACAYASIYCDSSRKEHYPQKRLAKKIFNDIDAQSRFETVKDEVFDFIKKYKVDEEIFSDDTDEEKKASVVGITRWRFGKILDESEVENWKGALAKMYDDVE